MSLVLEAVCCRAGGRTILAGVDLAVAAGEVVSLIGQNGAGKSTLIKCVNGIVALSGGDIRVEGRRLGDWGRRDLARTVAYVPQAAGSALAVSVIEMVQLGRAPHRHLGSGPRDRAVALDVIEQLGLQALAFRLFGELSGGERQRVLLARALAQGGSVLLLDEPTSALDLKHQLDTMTIVRRIARERRMAVLVAIHDLALAARFSDRLALLADGRVREAGAWDTVLTPDHLAAAYGVGAYVGRDRGLPYLIPVSLEVER
jgi:iron complex transport system ATP-binding protein